MHSKKYNILFLPSWYPNKVKPTFGIFVKRHAQAVALFHNVSVLYAIANPMQTSSSYSIETNIEKNVYSVTVYYKKTAPSLLSPIVKLWRYLRAYLKGYFYLRKQDKKTEIVHLHITFPAGIIALLLYMIYRIPFVISEHWTGYMPEDGSYKGAFLKYITRISVKLASAVIVVSEEMKQAMQTHRLKNNYYIIPNVVDPQLFFPQLEKKREGKVKILHVSAVDDRQKNISGILNVIKKLSDKRNDFVLEIIGQSEELPVFKEKAAHLGLLNSFVVFKGALPPEKVAEAMRNADFFLLFSHYEWQPCVLIEAMASGIPIVTSDVGGIPSIIIDKNGIMVESGNESALLKAIETMIDTLANYNNAEIRDYAITRFGYENVGEQINTVYQKALSAQ